MTILRTIPDDFAVRAATMTRTALRAHYRVGNSTLDGWIKAIGGRRHMNTGKVRGCPADFAEHGRLESNRELMARYTATSATITRWRHQTDAFRVGKPRAHKMPRGFALVAPTLSRKELRLRYRIGADVLDRLLEKAGVAARPSRLGSPAGRVFAPLDRPNRDVTQAGLAADYLRRFGSVYRCDVNGRQLADGFFWCRGGRVVLTDQELIERAMRNGWNPDAWKQVA